MDFYKLNIFSEILVSEMRISYICGMKFYNREKEIKKLLEIKEQLNYVMHHEFGHMVLNNNFGENINTILQSPAHQLLETNAHITIQYAGRKFLNLNGWNYKNIRGAFPFPNTFFGRKFTPYPHHENKLKPLLIKIK